MRAHTETEGRVVTHQTDITSWLEELIKCVACGMNELPTGRNDSSRRQASFRHMIRVGRIQHAFLRIC